MRDAFVRAGDVCQLRIKRPIPNEEELDKLRLFEASPTAPSRWGGPSRRSTSVDARLRAIGTSLTNVFSGTEASRNPGDAVRIWQRLRRGSGSPFPKNTSRSVHGGECGDVRHSDFGHGDALDGEPLLRALLITGRPPVRLAELFADGSRVINAGWEAPKHAPGPALAHAARLGLAAAAWLALDDRR